MRARDRRERPAPGGDQVGGIPDNIGAEIWPNCPLCSCPMTFIAQITVEPDREPRYPERGYLAIFLCNSDPPTSDDVCVTAEGPGSACFFVGEDQRAATCARSREPTTASAASSPAPST